MEKEKILSQSIGNIQNSRIDKVEQSIYNSINIPEEVKEATLLWLDLSREDLEFKQQMREQAAASERREAMRECISRCRDILFRAFIGLGLVILLISVFFGYALPLWQISQTYPSANKINALVKALFSDEFMHRKPFFGIEFMVCVVGYFLVARVLGFFLGKRWALKKKG